MIPLLVLKGLGRKKIYWWLHVCFCWLSCKLLFLPQVGWSKMQKLLQQRDEETKKSRYSLNEAVCNNFLQKNIYEMLMQFWKACGVDSFKWFSNNITRDLLIKDEKLTSWWYLWALGYEFKMIRMLDLKVNTFESHHYVIMFNSCLQQLGCFLQVRQFPPPWYNWNIVESGNF